VQVEPRLAERLAAMADLIQRSLPPVTAPRRGAGIGAARLVAAPAHARSRWMMPPASASRPPRSFERRQSEGRSRRLAISAWTTAAPVDDARARVRLRFPPCRAPAGARSAAKAAARPWAGPWPEPAPVRPALGFRPAGRGVGLAVVLVLLFMGVAVGAYPAVRRLTRRLEGAAARRRTVRRRPVQPPRRRQGRDEVAAVATSFNQAAGRIETLLRVAPERCWPTPATNCARRWRG
jgi:hypothetical protein